MAGLCWMAVTLAFFLSAQHSVAAVDQNRLTKIVDGVLGLYGTKGMFSLAVRIPDDQNQNIQNILQTLSESDPVKPVREKFTKNEVYVGKRLVAAKVLKKQSRGADHAESRVVAHLQGLWDIHQNVKEKNQNEVKSEMLLFYVYASPCVEKCTNSRHRDNILNRIGLIKNWQNYAFVFSKIFKPRVGKPNTPEDLKQALERLGGAIGLVNIYRCDKQDGQMQCRSCSAGGQVDEYCFSDEVNFSNPDDDATAPGTSIQPQPGSSYSPSRRRSSSVNPSAGVSTNVDSNTGGGRGIGGKVRKVGGRRVWKKQRKGGNEQKKKQAQTKKKKQANKRKKTSSRGKTGWSQKVPWRVKKNTEKKQNTRPRRNKKKRKIRG
uniref:uncharacterized protein si:dkey-96g2.1 isoform X2 n=1 Tax=Scatophagus argus TaxID=75038 RepID=UPI001ED85820|nr:uncharacterized protein si:dkey-96g2.1 isoform X2 [Scatophagus argus]